MAREGTVIGKAAARRGLALMLAPLLSGCILTTEAPTGSVVDVPPKYRAASGKPYAALPAPDWWRGSRSPPRRALNHYFFPGAGGAGRAAHRAQHGRRRNALSRRLPGAHRGRHRDRV